MTILGRSEELVSRCVECDLAEPESLASLGGSAPGVVDGILSSLFIVAKTHECNEVLEPTYTPCSEPEEQELFEAKQTFMFSVFNASLQTDMGKTIVRRHLVNTDAQAVWKELSEHMRTSSKGASKKRSDRILSTTPGADPPRDARDSGSARSHSMHLETSSSDRP